jgi:restriction system protein
MLSESKKRPERLEMTVTWMLGCLVLLISNSTIFKSFNASIGDPWLNLLLSGVILTLLGRIAIVFHRLQKDVRVSNSRIDRVDQLNDEDFASCMLPVYKRLGWIAEPHMEGLSAQSCLELLQGQRRVLALFQTGRRKLTKEYVTASHSKLRSGYNGTGHPEIWLVTNASFTSQACREASRLGIRLVDRDALIDVLIKAGSSSSTVVRGGTGFAE